MGFGSKESKARLILAAHCVCQIVFWACFIFVGKGVGNSIGLGLLPNWFLLVAGFFGTVPKRIIFWEFLYMIQITLLPLVFMGYTSALSIFFWIIYLTVFVLSAIGLLLLYKIIREIISNLEHPRFLSVLIGAGFLSFAGFNMPLFLLFFRGVEAWIGDSDSSMLTIVNSIFIYMNGALFFSSFFSKRILTQFLITGLFRGELEMKANLSIKGEKPSGLLLLKKLTNTLFKVESPMDLFFKKSKQEDTKQEGTIKSANQENKQPQTQNELMISSTKNNKKNRSVPCAGDNKETERKIAKSVMNLDQFEREAGPQLEKITEDEEKCYICCENEADAVVLDCGHGGICFACGESQWKTHKTCSMCREPIRKLCKIKEIKALGVAKVVETKTISVEC